MVFPVSVAGVNKRVISPCPSILISQSMEVAPMRQYLSASTTGWDLQVFLGRLVLRVCSVVLIFSKILQRAQVPPGRLSSFLLSLSLSL